MNNGPAQIAELHSILRTIGSYPQQISILAELRDAERREWGDTIAEWALPEQP